MIDLIHYKKIFLGFSIITAILALVCIVVFGLRPGIDLRGGTNWQLGIQKGEVNENTIHELLAKEIKAGELKVVKGSDGSFLVRAPDMTPEMHDRLLTAMRTEWGEVQEKNFSTIGPTIGAELQRKSFLAIILVLVGISLYIAWAFRKVSEPVKSWKYGIITLITLFHDVIIPAGLLALLGYTHGVEVDTNSIVALLVVMGFSVHDTIVVFDRIRENLLHARGTKKSLGEIINASVNETFARSVNTSLTLIIVLVTLLFLGPAPLYYFILTILIGTVFGTYSSIFVASPLLYLTGKKG